MEENKIVFPNGAEIRYSAECALCKGDEVVRDPVLLRWVPCKCQKDEPKVVMKTIEHGGVYE